MRTATYLVLLITLAFSASAEPAPKPISKYTSTAEKKGKVLKAPGKDAELADSFEVLLPGLGGYELILASGDSRSWLNVKHGKTITDLYQDTMANAPGHFPNKANDVVEWRGIEKSGQFTPYAFIYRINGYNEEKNLTKTRLLVFRLADGKAEYIGYAEGKNEDEKAKQLADSKGR